MRNILKVVIGYLIVVVIILILDLFSIFIYFKPIVGIKDNNMYKGMFFYVHYCNDNTLPQIKSKISKYNCSIEKN